MMADDGRWTTGGDFLPSVVGRPSSILLILAALAFFVFAGACLGLTAVAAQRVELFHATLFSVCRMRSYDLHWQNAQRLPIPFSYDFVKSPDSFVLVEIWVADGPTLSFSQRLPLKCW
jgi:ribose/xylose/arabinose/galactoside ABC-type transport system permease subunit